MEAMTSIRDENKLKIPRKYEKHYKKAYLTFKFQRVYCPRRECIVHIENAEDNTYG